MLWSDDPPPPPPSILFTRTLFVDVLGAEDPLEFEAVDYYDETLLARHWLSHPDVLQVRAERADGTRRVYPNPIYQ